MSRLARYRDGNISMLSCGATHFSSRKISLSSRSPRPIRIPATQKVCVDKIQSPATERVCLDKIRGRVQKLNHKSWTIKRGIKYPEPAAAGSGRVSYPPPPGMLAHRHTLPHTHVTRLTLIHPDCHLLRKKPHRKKAPERLFFE